LVKQTIKKSSFNYHLYAKGIYLVILNFSISGNGIINMRSIFIPYYITHKSSLTTNSV